MLHTGWNLMRRGVQNCKNNSDWSPVTFTVSIRRLEEIFSIFSTTPNVHIYKIIFHFLLFSRLVSLNRMELEWRNEKRISWKGMRDRCDAATYVHRKYWRFKAVRDVRPCRRLPLRMNNEIAAPLLAASLCILFGFPSDSLRLPFGARPTVSDCQMRINTEPDVPHLHS